MGLAVFILNRLLWNPDIAAEYRHPTVPHLYREGNYHFQNQVIFSTEFWTSHLTGSIFFRSRRSFVKIHAEKIAVVSLLSGLGQAVQND